MNTVTTEAPKSPKTLEMTPELQEALRKAQAAQQQDAQEFVQNEPKHD